MGHVSAVLFQFSSEQYCPSVLDLTMALESFGHTLRVAATSPLRHNCCCYSWLKNCSTEGLLKIVGFLLKTFILCFSAVVSEYCLGSTSPQKQQINGNQICLVLFLFRKLFQMHPGTKLESQFCKNSFKWDYCCGILHSFKTNYTWWKFPLVTMTRQNWVLRIFPISNINFL